MLFVFQEKQARLARQRQALEDARKQVYETEEVGQGVLTNLSKQREQIQNTRGKVSCQDTCAAYWHLVLALHYHTQEYLVAWMVVHTCCQPCRVLQRFMAKTSMGLHSISEWLCFAVLVLPHTSTNTVHLITRSLPRTRTRTSLLPFLVCCCRFPCFGVGAAHHLTAFH